MGHYIYIYYLLIRIYIVTSVYISINFADFFFFYLLTTSLIYSIIELFKVKIRRVLGSTKNSDATPHYSFQLKITHILYIASTLFELFIEKYTIQTYRCSNNNLFV